MRYLLMIYSPEDGNPASEDEAIMMAEYGTWADKMGQQGVLRGGERLRPTTDATTVQVRDGKVLTSDGPFAETKEQMGGFFIVDVANLDEAIEAASGIPGARHGSIEVRPIWEM